MKTTKYKYAVCFTGIYGTFALIVQAESVEDAIREATGKSHGTSYYSVGCYVMKDQNHDVETQLKLQQLYNLLKGDPSEETCAEARSIVEKLLKT